MLWQLSTVESLVKPMIAGGCCKGLPELFVDVMRRQRAAGMVLNLRNRIKSQGATASENEAKDAVLVLSCLICNLMNDEAGVIALCAPSLRKAAVRARRRARVSSLRRFPWLPLRSLRDAWDTVQPPHPSPLYIPSYSRAAGWIRAWCRRCCHS